MNDLHKKRFSALADMVRGCAICIFLTAQFLSVVETHAGEVPVPERSIDIVVGEQSVSEFIKVLFQEINVPVIVESEPEGSVSGEFQGDAKKIIDDVEDTFDVIVYFDGAVAHVYLSNQLTQRLLPISVRDAQRVRGLLNRTGLIDKYNRLENEDGGLLVTGVPKFQQQVDEFVSMVNRTKSFRNTAKTATSTNQVPDLPPIISNMSFPPPEVESEKYGYRVFKLKYAWAENTSYSVRGQSVEVRGVASLLRELVYQRGAIANTQVRAAENSSTVDSVKGEGLANSRPEREDVSDVSDYTEFQRTGSIKIIADSRLNAVIVSDIEDRLDIYEDLIKSLDVESEMVEVEATIIDINSDRTQELGVDWRSELSDGEVTFSNGQEDPFNPFGEGGVLSLSIGDAAEFLARVRALERDGAAQVVSKPHIITLSNLEGVLGSTSEFFVRVAGEEEVDLFNVSVGTTLRVRPHVFEDSSSIKKVKLSLDIEDGADSSGETVDGIPVVTRASIKTQAIVDNGASLLVGGLARQSFTQQESKVPVLGSIPVIGHLFKNSQRSGNRFERLFLITPRVTENKRPSGKVSAPRLVGSGAVIPISSLRRDLDNVEWPAERRQRLKPMEFQNELVNSVASGKQDTQLKPTVLPRDETTLVIAKSNEGGKLKSPFTVERWHSNE